MKKTYAERFSDKIASYTPNIKDSILSYTELPSENLMKNIMSLFRPFYGASEYKTPIKNLYLYGASTWPGGGMNASSGYFATRTILKGK